MVARFKANMQQLAVPRQARTTADNFAEDTGSPGSGNFFQ
jgi:hypothetical protein